MEWRMAVADWRAGLAQPRFTACSDMGCYATFWRRYNGRSEQAKRRCSATREPSATMELQYGHDGVCMCNDNPTTPKAMEPDCRADLKTT